MEAKSREPKMCYKCRLHGLRTLYKGGHGRICQFRDCPCEYCTKYEVARNYENNLRAHVQELEERSGVQKPAEPKVEIEVKLEVKTEPMEYFSSDEQDTSFGRIDPSSISLDTSDNDLNITAGITLNQSDDLNWSDSDLNQSSLSFPNINTAKPTEEFCPYCENIFAKPFEDHVKTCATAKQFEEQETEDLGNIDQFLESDLSDEETPNELDPAPIPSTSAVASDNPVHVLSTSPIQCPICLSDFPHFSHEELEAHAGSCQDFISLPDVRNCFMCDQEFSSEVPEIQFQHHVEGHFKDKDLQELNKYPLLGVQNVKKRKLDCAAPMKTSPSKLTKEFQGSHQTHSSRKLPEVNMSPKSSTHQIKGNKQQSLVSTQTQSNGFSSRINQSPGSSQSQLTKIFVQMNQSPESSQPQVKKEEFPQLKHATGPSLHVSNKVPQIKSELKPPPIPPNTDSHIQSLISRFEESCSQPAVHQFFVAADMVGLIIGEKAWFKRKVLEDTGVSISVENRKSQVSGPVPVTLIGPSVNLPKAVAMIQLKLGPRVGLM